MPKKLFLSSIVLIVLSSLCFVTSVKADVSMWSQTYGGTGYESAYSVANTSDGGYAIAGIIDSLDEPSYSVWLVKTDAYGVVEWNKSYGEFIFVYMDSMPTACVSCPLIVTSDGGYAIASVAWLMEKEGKYFVLIKTDELGNLEWNQTYYGGIAYDDGKVSLVEVDGGGYALVGDMRSTEYSDWGLIRTDASGTMLWNKTYGGTRLLRLMEGM